MASITKLPSGKHRCRVRVRGFPLTSKSFHKAADARAWGFRIEADMQSGRWKAEALVASHVTTLADALDLYRETVTPTKRGAVQEANLIKLIRKAPESKELCGKRFADVAQADIAKLRDRWLASGLAPSTTRNRLALLSHAFVIAQKEWSMPVGNPVAMVRKPIVRNERTRRLLVGEFDRVLAATRSDDLPDIATLALATAARLGEIVALRWEHVDLVARSATFPITKNGSARVIPLSPIALVTLRDLPRREDGKVFKMTRDGASQAWTSAVRRAREDYQDESAVLGRALDPRYLVDLHFHDIRHSALSVMAEMGLSVLELSAIGGHRTLQMLRRYSHLDNGLLADRLAAGSLPRPTTPTTV